eukprot:3813903-Pyramimonas_sp.AAC.1
MSDVAVLKRLGMAPTTTELRVRRLRQYQRWLRAPDRHPQELAVMFGELPLEPTPTLDDEGSVATDANPYAQRFVEDVETLLTAAGDDELREDLQTAKGSLNVAALFFNDDLRERYLVHDPGMLRAQARAVAIPPPGWQP